MDLLLPLKIMTTRKLRALAEKQTAAGEGLVTAGIAEAWGSESGWFRPAIVFLTTRRLVVIEARRLVPLQPGKTIGSIPYAEADAMLWHKTRGGMRRSITLPTSRDEAMRLDFAPLWWPQYNSMRKALTRAS